MPSLRDTDTGRDGNCKSVRFLSIMSFGQVLKSVVTGTDKVRVGSNLTTYSLEGGRILGNFIGLPKNL